MGGEGKEWKYVEVQSEQDTWGEGERKRKKWNCALAKLKPKWTWAKFSYSIITFRLGFCAR